MSKVALVEPVVHHSFHLWREQPDGTIRLKVISGDLTGAEWMEFGNGGKPFRVSRGAGEILVLSNNIGQNPDVVTKVTVLRGRQFSDLDRTMTNVRAKAFGQGLIRPLVEMVCLIRETISKEELKKMGFRRILVMSEPVADFRGRPVVLGLCRNINGCYEVQEFRANPETRLGRDDGFAFVCRSD